MNKRGSERVNKRGKQFRVTVKLGDDNGGFLVSHYRAGNEKALRDLMTVCVSYMSTANDYWWQKLMEGETIKVTAFGEWSMELADPVEAPCGECDPCRFEEHEDDEPQTHCINCTCIMCIPGA